MMQADATAEDAMEAGVAMTATRSPTAASKNATATALQTLEMLESDEKKDGPCGERTLKTRIAQGVAIASFAINIVAMVWEQSIVAILAGIVACIIAPVVVYHQFLIQDIDSMRDVQNALRKQANRLVLENNKFCAENNRFEAEVGKLKQREVRLRQITTEQGTNVEEFVRLVKDNQETLNALKSCVNAQTVSLLVEAILRSDMDANATFSDTDLKALELFLNNVQGVRVNHEALKQNLKKSSRNLSGVLDLVKNMDDVPSEERIFIIEGAAGTTTTTTTAATTGTAGK